MSCSARDKLTTEEEGITRTKNKDRVFQADERVAPLVEQDHAETFGLVLVAGWPLTSSQERSVWLESYYRLLAAITLCFVSQDVAVFGTQRSSIGPPPPVYLYPATALHVTVATLHSINQQPPGVLVEADKQEKLKSIWKDVVDQARQLPEWPRQPLQLSLDSIRLDPKAGILLWKDTTGGITAMRKCLQQIVDDQKQHCKDIATDNNKTHPDDVWETLHIPDIIHTTFLRYYRVPETPATIVQERFAQTVLPRIHEFFPTHIPVSNVTLVCERVPFMHIPVDEHHILERYDLRD